MATDKFYAVFDWRQDSRYHLADCIGARIFKREHAAQAFADKMMGLSTRRFAPQFVVRSSDYFYTSNTRISANGKVEVTIPCPCGFTAVQSCVFHGVHGLPAYQHIEN